MIHGPEWHFLRLGKFLERAAMLCKILEVKHKTLELHPEQEGRPIDFHQWQGMLRSVSAYEPYRRVYDARIVPSRVLDLVLNHPQFPQSFHHCLLRIEESLAAVTSDAWIQRDLLSEVQRAREQVAAQPGSALLHGGLESHVRELSRRCGAIAGGIEAAFFRVRRRAPRESAPRPLAARQTQVQQ
jgi:uncharacterized alpha-E superfamily protein